MYMMVPGKTCYVRPDALIVQADARIAAVTSTPELPIEVGGRSYLRLPIRTHVLSEKDTATAVLERYVRPHWRSGDTVFISETAVAIMQGRARDHRKITPSWLARKLARLVTKSPYGVGLRSPYAMQYAIELSGAHRILAGCVWHVVGRALGKKGWFYSAAGVQARMMDAEHTMGVKEFYECVIPGPADPPGTCRKIKAATGMDTAIVDVNDIFPPWCVASTLSSERARLLEDCLTDNPLGQGNELTPLGIWREA